MAAPPPPRSSGSPEPSRLLDLTGLVIDDRYIVGRQLGIGAMGVVYEATHRTLGRKVAVKLLRGEHTGNQTFRRRFEREALFASRLQHPNVVHIMDFGELPGGPLYLVMEYLSGIDLRELLKQEGPLPPERVRKFLMQILRGIAAAHDAGVIHRDIKPANCFLTQSDDGHELVKVVDFGVARLEDENGASALTGVAEVVGSVAYVAPEMIMGQTANVRTDVYALGVMTYEMLTGANPFLGKDLYQVMENHLQRSPPPLPSSVPESLRQLVERALQKEPSNRFDDVHQMLAALDQGEVVRSARPTDAPPAAEVLSPEAPPPPPSHGSAHPHAPVQPSEGKTSQVSTVFVVFSLVVAVASMLGMLALAQWISGRYAL